jgi:hypothetical protein
VGARVGVGGADERGWRAEDGCEQAVARISTTATNPAIRRAGRSRRRTDIPADSTEAVLSIR